MITTLAIATAPILASGVLTVWAYVIGIGHGVRQQSAYRAGEAAGHHRGRAEAEAERDRLATELAVTRELLESARAELAAHLRDGQDVDEAYVETVTMLGREHTGGAR